MKYKHLYPKNIRVILVSQNANSTFHFIHLSPYESKIFLPGFNWFLNSKRTNIKIRAIVKMPEVILQANLYQQFPAFFYNYYYFFYFAGPFYKTVFTQSFLPQFQWISESIVSLDHLFFIYLYLY